MVKHILEHRSIIKASNFPILNFRKKSVKNLVEFFVQRNIIYLWRNLGFFHTSCMCIFVKNDVKSDGSRNLGQSIEKIWFHSNWDTIITIISLFSIGSNNLLVCYYRIVIKDIYIEKRFIDCQGRTWPGKLSIHVTNHPWWKHHIVFPLCNVFKEP